MKTYILHQVNCLGAFGAGFAKYLASFSPIIPNDYRHHVSLYKDKCDLLGTYHITPLSSDIFIVHLFSQFEYGTYKVQTDYEAMKKALDSFRKDYPSREDTYICPYLMGCGLAGGDWNIVGKMIEEHGIMPVKNIQLKMEESISYITFAGSRKTPEEIIERYKKVAETLAGKGYILRSGNASGFDQVVSDVDEESREIYLPYKGFGPNISGKHIYVPSNFDNYEKAVALVRELHPNKHLNETQMKYLARDVYQVLGKDLRTPSSVVYCWTNDGAECTEKITRETGGTAMAIRVAECYHIPVINLKNRRLIRIGKVDEYGKANISLRYDEKW